ncbi:macrolide transport system ATP-binding/permease protein [Actinorugispora endophytica]|uniref:Macrolide transport system ATP-binding/permease protein n=1 Tax=Actinorugispora endophytica TaxID=1605990 RepID=A0A4R6UUC3_9ACTN|nr:macrolide transport system ATP-binding/permease protein [Actinorugispora endophytica]
MLTARDLAKTYGSRVVFDGLSLDVAPGQRLGLVGENGVGKSTLLRLLAGAEEPDAGTVARPADTGFLRQELPYPPETALGAVVEDALGEVRAVEAALAAGAEALDARPDDAAVLTAYGAALEHAEAREVWDADRRAAMVLEGLGLAGIAAERPLSTLSGGQRSRLGLAALLVRRPRALLLDEPTNHLDDDALAFLSGHLRAMPGAVVLAGHDRVFLDEACTGIVDLDPSREGRVHYGGAYTYYLREKRTERLRWEQQYADEQARLRELRESVHARARRVGQFRPMKDGNKMDYDGMGEHVQRQISRRVRNARRRLDELERDQVRRPPRPLSFSSALTGAAAAGGHVLTVRGVEVPGRLRVDALDLPADGRLLVTGPNGAGKTTLLHVLARTLVPPTGTVRWRRGATVALLEQDVVFRRPELTPTRLFEAMTARTADPPVLGELGLVAPRDLDRPVGVLSVGQRRRLALALLVARAPQVLLLDEPTNHISLALAEELEEALRASAGAVVVATHDRWLRRGWDGPELRLEQGRALAGSG